MGSATIVSVQRPVTRLSPTKKTRSIVQRRATMVFRVCSACKSGSRISYLWHEGGMIERETWVIAFLV